MSATMPTDAEMLAEAGRLVAAVQRGQLEDYKRRYRAFVISKLAARRDSYDQGSPEWKALDQLLRDLGAAPRDPEAVPAEMPGEAGSAAA